MYKALRRRDGQIVSDFDGSPWTIGVQRSISNHHPIIVCENGFHASPTIIRAFCEVEENVIAEVTASGEKDLWNGISAWEHMTITKAWDWTREDTFACLDYLLETLENTHVFSKKKKDNVSKCISESKDYARTARISVYWMMHAICIMMDLYTYELSLEHEDHLMKIIEIFLQQRLQEKQPIEA